MLCAGTGDNHSAPATNSSDSVLAFSLDSRDIEWSRQLTTGDMGNGACFASDKANCPEPHGPDFDLGASANLITLQNGKRLLTMRQKSGIVWALDPDDPGRILWKTRVGKGGILGGVQWGTATDGKLSTSRYPTSRSSIHCLDNPSFPILIKAADCTPLLRLLG